MEKKYIDNEDKKEIDMEDEKEDEEENEDEPTYIAGDDWIIPIQFDRDISSADIIFTMKKGDFKYEDESIAGDHKEKVAIFKIPSKTTEKLEAGEYKWMVSVIEDENKVSTKPECIYVETL